MPNDMRYFLYVSHAKLDLLYEQARQGLPISVEGSAEVEVKWNFFKAGLRLFKRDRTPAERISVVEERLREQGLIGLPHAPLSYFSGVMNARWSGINANKHAVVFYGESDDARIGLVGSKKHLIGV